MIMWLKGYSVIITYDQEICNQSGNTNRGTPCIYQTIPLISQIRTATLSLMETGLIGTPARSGKSLGADEWNFREGEWYMKMMVSSSKVSIVHIHK